MSTFEAARATCDTSDITGFIAAETLSMSALFGDASICCRSARFSSRRRLTRAACRTRLTHSSISTKGLVR